MIAPLDPVEFFSEKYGRSFHVSNPLSTSDLVDLSSWDEFNECLTMLREETIGDILFNNAGSVISGQEVLENNNFGRKYFNHSKARELMDLSDVSTYVSDLSLG